MELFFFIIGFRNIKNLSFNKYLNLLSFAIQCLLVISLIILFFSDDKLFIWKEIIIEIIVLSFILIHYNLVKRNNNHIYKAFIKTMIIFLIICFVSSLVNILFTIFLVIESNYLLYDKSLYNKLPLIMMYLKNLKITVYQISNNLNMYLTIYIFIVNLSMLLYIIIGIRYFVPGFYRLKDYLENKKEE